MAKLIITEWIKLDCGCWVDCTAEEAWSLYANVAFMGGTHCPKCNKPVRSVVESSTTEPKQSKGAKP